MFMCIHAVWKFGRNQKVKSKVILIVLYVQSYFEAAHKSICKYMYVYFWRPIFNWAVSES